MRQLPEVRAERVLFHGEVMLSDGTTTSDPALRLDASAVKAVLADMRGGVLSFAARDEALKQFERRLKLRTSKDGGADPEGIAQGHEFGSAREMFEAIMRMPEEKAWAERRAGEMMVAAHPDLEATLAELRHEAEEALHSEGTLEGLQEELKMMRQKTPEARFTPIESLKFGSRQYVEGLSLRNLQLGRTRQKEQAAANKAAIEWARGNYTGGMEAKKLQVQFAHEWSAINEAIEEKGSFERFAKSLTDKKARGRMGKASPAHRDVVDTLLEALGFMEPQFREGPRAGFAQLAKAMEHNRDSPIDTEGLDAIVQGMRDYTGRTAGKTWEDLTVGQMWTVHDALKQISRSASHKNEITVDGKRVDKDELIDEQVRWTASNSHLRDRGELSSSVSATALIDAGLAVGEAFDAFLLKPRTMLGWFGGLESPIMRALWLPLHRAKGKASDLGREIYKPLTEAFENIPREVRKRLFEDVDGKALFPTHTEALSAPTKRFEVLMMLPNIGNESSAQRLTDGRNITKIDVIEAAQAIGVTAEELAWIQTLQDVVDQKLWPKVVELEERDQGVAPTKIEASGYTITTPTGRVAMRGWLPAGRHRRSSDRAIQISG